MMIGSQYNRTKRPIKRDAVDMMYATFSPLYSSRRWPASLFYRLQDLTEKNSSLEKIILKITRDLIKPAKFAGTLVEESIGFLAQQGNKITQSIVCYRKIDRKIKT